MSFENLELNEELEEEPAEPEETSNRTFLIIAGVLGFLALLALVCIAVYALVLVPRTRTAQTSQRATLDAQNTSVAAMVANTSTAAAQAAIIAAYTKTPTSTPVFTATSSPAPVVAATTAVVYPTDTPNAQTATAMALFATLDANATSLAGTFTAQPPQATAIPDTGFADDIGLPAMLGMAVLLIAVIFLARRLRTA